MKKLSDEELLEELKTRIYERKQAYAELEKLNKELHDANKRLMESEKLKSNFLSNARNEIINPLSSILSLSQSIASDDGTSASSKNLAGIIYKAAFDLDFQMNNIFSSAEIEAGEAVCEHYIINLKTLLEKSIEKFTGLANEHDKNLIINMSDADAEKRFISDPAKLQLIIDNLIVNAINWSKKTGDVRIIISVDDEEATIVFSDPGPGIDTGNQQDIFNRFKTLDPSVHTSNKGHGLGLSVAKSYIEMLDGSLDLESSPQSGSTFTIRIKNQPEEQLLQGSSGNGSEFLFDENTELF